MNKPILMVHGMCCTGLVWTQFRGFFEERGARVYTPTLRPELRVSWSGRPPRGLRDISLSDYVDDLEIEIRRIEDETGATPVAIGHSMGGLLCSALAARGRISAGVFISPAAAAGVRTLQSRVFWKAYGLARRFGLTPHVIRPDPRTLQRMVLNVMPAAERAAVLDAMVYESGRAFADFGYFPVDEKKVKVPVLTIAAGRDRLVPAALVRLSGRKFAAVGGEFREYPNHGHWLYSEPGWEIVASDIYDWIMTVTQSGAQSMRAPKVDAQPALAE